MKLRDYQQESVDGTVDYFREANGNPLIVMPTGSGKSIVMAGFIERVLSYPNQRVLVLAHVKELLVQNASAMRKMLPGVSIGLFSAGIGKKQLGRQVTVAGIQSIYKRAHDLGRITMVIIDECHLLPPKGAGRYRQFLADLQEINPKVKVVGLTATPYRMTSGTLIDDDGLFTDVAYDCDIKGLVLDGWLAPLVTKRGRHRADVSGVAVRGGEFVAGELERAVNNEEVVRKAVAEFTALCSERKSWIVFCAGVAHAEAVAAEMVSAHGVPTQIITGDTPKAERDGIIRAFKDGRLRALVNVNVLTTGFDAPGIDALIMLRPTKSVGLYVQMCGRGMRVAEGKADCLVLDYANNVMEHGPIDMIYVPTRKGEGEMSTCPMKACPYCDEAIPLGVTECPYCGYLMPRDMVPKHDTKASEADIISPDKPRIFEVVSTEFAAHRKAGKPDSLKVTYDCGIERFSQWVCLEHSGYARRKANQWWRATGGQDPIPNSVSEAIERTRELKRVSGIAVNLSGRYPEIVQRRIAS